MKKMILCVLLTMSLMLSLASCNGGSDAVNSGDVEQDDEVISDGFTVSMQNAANAAGDVEEWLRGLGF